MGQENHRLPKQYRQACLGRIHKGQRGIVSRKSIWAGYGYARTSIIRVTRASQAIEGRCNAYQAYGLATPRFSYHRESLPPIVSGIIKSVMATHEKGQTIHTPRAEIRRYEVISVESAITRIGIARMKLDLNKAQPANPLLQPVREEAPGRCVDAPQGEVPTAITPQSVLHETRVGKSVISMNAPKTIPIVAPAKSDSQVIYQRPAPQYSAPAMNQSQAPAIQSVATQAIASNDMQDAIPQQQYQNCVETKAPVYFSPDLAIQTAFVMIPGKSEPALVKQGAPPALPYSEGLMGAPIEKTNAKIPNAIPARIAKGSGYISTSKRRTISLKTASAAAGMPL